MQLDYINGNKFADLADFVVHPPTNKMVDANILGNDGIIFCKTDHLNYLFGQLQFSNRKYILISHFSDYEIDERIFSSKPPCIKKWFAENAEFDHPDLIPIPIGLENMETRDGAVAGEIGVRTPWFAENIEMLRKNDKDEIRPFTAFVVDYPFAHKTWTNPHRKGIFETLDRNNLNYFKPAERLSHEDYCNLSSKYKFHVSPRGNGIDCHRTWELLYMGCTPIVLKNHIYKEWELPIIQLNSWNELTNEFIRNYKEKNINASQLEFSYWKDMIKSEFSKL